MRHYLYLLIFTVLTFVSCETELPEGTWSKEPPTTVTYQLSLNKTTIVAKAEGSSETFSITSDDSWTISTSEAWVKVSETTGNGDKAITVTVEANTGKEARTATITIAGKNSEANQTIAVSQEGRQSSGGTGTNGHEYVDLGLPSGLLWATCNVGASKPEDYGDYFAWGATKPQSVYDWVNTPYQTQNTTDYSKIKFTKYLGSTTPSYKDNSAKDSDALKTVLDLDDDAAHVNWGGSWRMPTKAELDELKDTNNCTWTWTTQNGVNGYKVTSKKNGNTLFLPAAGYRYDSSLTNVGSDGNYWSSSLDASTPYRAYCLLFDSGSVYWGDYYRYCGHSVRPVCASSE